jgi:uncharacterized glyoxalase superfamily protein PhnB
MSDLLFVSPFFIVANIRDSVDFYVKKLGFEIQYIVSEEDPYFAMIRRGPVSLMLKGGGRAVPNHTRYEWASWDAYFSVADPDALFEEFRAAGVTFHQPLHDNTDNIRGFALADVDGYRLFFGRPNL